jgi:hypothetical protein
VLAASFGGFACQGSGRHNGRKQRRLDERIYLDLLEMSRAVRGCGRLGMGSSYA